MERIVGHSAIEIVMAVANTVAEMLAVMSCSIGAELERWTSWTSMSHSIE